MAQAKLRGVFVELGYTEVGSVLGTGNIVFSANRASESTIQAALRNRLGIPGGTLLRTRKEIESMVELAPFGSREHSNQTYLVVSFVKGRRADLRLSVPPSGSVELLGYDPRAAAVLAVLDNTGSGARDYMAWLDRQIGSEVTTRTWNTVTRILAKMPA